MSDASTVTTAISDGQIAKFYEQVFHPAFGASEITEPRFQLILEQEKDLQVRTRFEEFLRQLDSEVMGSETISVDYDELNAILAAFEANDFGGKWVDVDLTAIKVEGKGKVDHKVYEWHPNRLVYNREIWPQANLKKIKPGYKFPNFLTALKYALKLPDRQLDHPLVILFELNGLLCYLCLGRSGGLRRVGVDRANLDDRWSGSVRFLLVRE